MSNINPNPDIPDSSLSGSSSAHHLGKDKNARDVSTSSNGVQPAAAEDDKIGESVTLRHRDRQAIR